MKKKIKLRDLTPEQYSKYKEGGCGCNGSYNECVFGSVNCVSASKSCWVFHKDLYSDKFLDQEIEIEIPPFTDKEKTYLHNFLEPYRDRIVAIKVCRDTLRPDYANLVIKVESIVEEVIIEEIYLPLFKIGTMYTGLKIDSMYETIELRELLRELELL